MNATVEKRGPTEVQLIIEVPFDELATLKEETLRRLSREVKVPGFRRGKVPPAVMETRLGKEHIRQELLKDALPMVYSEAIKEHQIRPLAQPEIEVTQFADRQPLTFTAKVQVRPEINLPEYEGIQVRAPSPKASEQDINNQLERIRERFGTLEPVARNAMKGDFVTIDLFGFRHGEPLEGATLQDLNYEVGSARFLPRLDDELTGKRPGDIVEFNARLPRGFGPSGDEEEATLKVVVKQVQTKKLPELDDEFARTASEFDTLEDLKADIGNRISGHKSKDSEVAIRNLILEDLLGRTEVPLPESLVAKETEIRLARLMQDLGSGGMAVDAYLEANQISREDLLETYRKAAEVAVSADLVLEAIAKDRGMEVTPEDLRSEIALLADQMNQDAKTLADNIARSGSLTALAGDILRRKALDYLVEHASITDESAAAQTVRGENG